MPLAYIAAANDNALTILDVSDPANPTFVGSIQGAGIPNFLSNAFRVFVLGKVAYVTGSVDDALSIFNVSTPSAPVLLGSIQGIGAPNFLNGATGVVVVGDFAYVAAVNDDALSIFNVSDPTAPVLAGSIQGAGAPNFLNGARGVAVVGDFAYVVAAGDDALSIFNVSIPSAPVLVGSIQGTGGPNFLNQPFDIVVVGAFAYVTGSVDDALSIFNVSDPANPTFVGSIQGAGAPNFLGGAAGVAVVGDLAYVGSPVDDALSIFNVSTPSAPVLLGSIQGIGAPNFLNGATGVVVVGDFAYVAAVNDDALSIFNVSDPTNPTFVASIRGAGAPNFLNGARGITIPVTIPTVPSPPVIHDPGGSFTRRLSGGRGGFLSYITPDGRTYPFHTPHDIGRWVISYSGFGTPPIEYITERGPFQHGATVRDYFLQPRVIQLFIRQAFCDRVAWWGGRADLLNEIRPNRQATPTGVQPGELQLVETDGTIRSLNVWIQEGPRFEPRESTQWDEWAFQEVLRFVAYDPVAFDPTQVVAAFAVAVAAQLVFPITFPIQFGTGDLDETLAVTYPGTWLSFPIITIVGPIETPRLDNVTTGEKIEFSINIAAGRTVTIDLTEGNKTVVDDLGNNLIGGVTPDSDLGTFHLAPDPEAPLGVNTLRLRGTNPAGPTAVSLAYFERYFGF